jgi:hypothetical protein
MSDTALPVIFRFDTTANRVAFTPTPGVAEQLYIWEDSDDQPNAYYWDGAAWQALNGDTGITQLTGNVTAGPGSGSQVATIANDAVTYAKMQNISATDRILGRDTAGAGDTEEIPVSSGLEFTGGPGLRVTAAVRTMQVGITIDGGGSVPSTGVKGYKTVPVTGTITGVRMLADQAGSAVIDIWKDTYANYPPTNADSITAAATPTISAADKSEDTTLTGWTTAVTAGDVLGFNLDSITTITRVTLELTIVVS